MVLSHSHVSYQEEVRLNLQIKYNIIWMDYSLNNCVEIMFTIKMRTNCT